LENPLSRLTLSPILLFCAIPLVAADTALELDPARTRIEFTLGDVLHRVHGTFQLKRGTIRFDPATGSASGEAVVDVSSGDSGGGARDRRMHKEILESDRYPEAVFAPDRIEGRLSPDGESQVDIHGQFRIHGASHEMTLHAVVGSKGPEVTATGRFVIPYVKWGMKNPSTFILRVSSQVEVEVRTSGRVTVSGEQR
jgi:polyisoprenoid-binding protein YceI